MPPHATRPRREQRLHQHREEARRIILDATEALLVEEGYDRFSMRRLAERCGYTAPTIYHYFQDKERLVETLLRERLVRFVDDLRRVPRGRDDVEDLRARCRAFTDFGLRNPTHYRLLVMPQGERAEAAPLPEEEAARELFDRPFEALVRSGRLRAADLEPARQSLWALLHGLIVLQTTRPDEDWAPDLVGQAIDAALRGWLRPAAGDPPRGDDA